MWSRAGKTEGIIGRFAAKNQRRLHINNWRVRLANGTMDVGLSRPRWAEFAAFSLYLFSERESAKMSKTYSVGIDLGTTYSCIAYLNEQGEPISIPNKEGEISTPSVVMFDDHEVIVGTEALRNAIMHPTRVVQNAKRWMGDPKKKWIINGKSYTPSDIATEVLKKLLADAEKQIGTIERAVITVPAQFSEGQRLATVAAGKAAGLTQVDIINEPVAAALCFVLGTEGDWYSQLADDQRVLVYDLGGGTFDLSLVNYTKDQVRVVASTGDLHLGGIDWNQCLLNAVAEQFNREFGDDPRRDPESLQHLAWEVEQCKRSLTVRPKAALICQHGGKRKTYQIERDQFNQLTQHLVEKTHEITRQLIDQNRKGTSHLDLTVLSVGGSSRMPMIDDMLNKLKGTKVSKVLSPDQSIAHGAAYYAGMLLSNNKSASSIAAPAAVERLSKMRQQSVNARDLGILIRDVKTNTRVPFYLIPANTPLPASATKVFGTVIPNQKRVNLFIVESGAGTDRPYSELGNCTIHELPPNLPAESKIVVKISYDESARVQVSAHELTSGRMARVEINRGISPDTIDSIPIDTDYVPIDERQTVPRVKLATDISAAVPLALCETCEAFLNDDGTCPKCSKLEAKPAAAKETFAKPPAKPAAPVKAESRSGSVSVRPVPVSRGTAPLPRKPEANEIMELPRPKPAVKPAGKPKRPAKPDQSPSADDPGEEEFWNFAEK